MGKVREREADIDETITPLEEMYGLLSRYEVRGVCCHDRSLQMSLKTPQAVDNAL